MRRFTRLKTYLRASTLQEVLCGGLGSGGPDLHRHHWPDQGDLDIRYFQRRPAGHLCRPVCRKCYPHTNDFKNWNFAPRGFKGPFWRILDRLSDDLYVLSQTQNSHVRYAPLYIHSFVLCTPRKILEATQFNQRYHRYEEIDNVPDRLRWCRHNRALLQKDVAGMVGINRNTYMNMESGATKQVPVEVTQKLADFYDVPMTDFLDGYNRFLYDGQVERIRKYRESTGLGRKPFAREKGIPIRSFLEWESGRKVVSQNSWEKYFKGKA